MKIKLISSCLVPLSGVISPSFAGTSADKPNIVIILSDDQGWGDLGISGNKNLSTPNIDMLARSGVRFNHFYVCPVSSPTRAELLTGRYHDRMGVHGVSEGAERMNTGETTIAEVFKKAGYATAAFGKWHNGMQSPYHPNARGFDEFYGFCSGHWGEYFNSQFMEHNGEFVRGNGYITDDLTDHAISFMEENRNNPFFLYVPYNTPHSPLQVPDKWWDNFRNKKLEMFAGEGLKEDTLFTRGALAMCENIDWNVGRIMSKLGELGLQQNTIVLYFSDNGPDMWRWNAGMKGKKGSLDEGGIRSQLIISWPGKIKPGSQVDDIAGVIDLLPTLTDLAGIKCSTLNPLDGISLKGQISGKKPKNYDRELVSSWNGNISIRNNRYRLDSKGQLFDINNDPGQKKNISSELPETAEKLRSSAEKFRKEVISPVPTDKRPFTIGYPGSMYTQLPARDGKGYGNIIRSNKSPNSTYFTGWKSSSDSICWNAEVLTEGDYEVEAWYTCPPKDTGSVIQLSFGGAAIAGRLTKPSDPPLRGMENDRYPRTQSYVKEFTPLNLGVIHLKKGTGFITLRALDIPGSQVMDFRLLMFRRIDQSIKKLKR